MIDWQDKIHRSKLVSSLSGTEIPAGSYFFSSLHLLDGQFLRRDFLESEWHDDLAKNCLSWWRHRRPLPVEDTGPRIVNHAILLDIFHDLEDTRQRDQQCFAWLLALLLTRAKKLRYLDLQREDDATFMVLENRQEKRVFRVRDPQMNEVEEQAVLQNLTEVFEMPGLPAAQQTETSGN